MEEIINITENKVNPVFGEANAIVFSFDDNYAKYFSVALQSLIENSDTNKKYDIVVFEDGISELLKLKLLSQIPENFSLRFFDIKKYLMENYSNLVLKEKAEWSIATYYRLFIPFVMSDYNRVLYLDTDVIINQNIDDLFNIDFEGKKLLVSKDIITYQEKELALKQIEHIETALKVNIDNYFNAGMLVYNIKNINLTEYKNNLIEAFKIKDLMYPDQDMLNKIFYNDLKYLPFYNFQISKIVIERIKEEYRQEFYSAFSNPKIIHYISSDKPWRTPWNILAERFWYYARRTPFYEEIIYTNVEYRNEKKLTPLEKWFSVTNGYYRSKKYKVVTILGQRIKLD